MSKVREDPWLFSGGEQKREIPVWSRPAGASLRTAPRTDVPGTPVWSRPAGASLRTAPPQMYRTSRANQFLFHFFRRDYVRSRWSGNRLTRRCSGVQVLDKTVTNWWTTGHRFWVCFVSHDYHLAQEHTHSAARPTGGRRHSPVTKQPGFEIGRFGTGSATHRRWGDVTFSPSFRFYKIHLCVKEKQLNRQMVSLSPRVPRRRDGYVKFAASARRSQHMHMFCSDTKHGRHVATHLLCLFKRWTELHYIAVSSFAPLFNVR